MTHGGKDKGCHQSGTDVLSAIALSPAPLNAEGVQEFSYVISEENDVIPIFVLKFVSKTYGEEYTQKMTD